MHHTSFQPGVIRYGSCTRQYSRYAGYIQFCSYLVCNAHDILGSVWCRTTCGREPLQRSNACFGATCGGEKFIVIKALRKRTLGHKRSWASTGSQCHMWPIPSVDFVKGDARDILITSASFWLKAQLSGTIEGRMVDGGTGPEALRRAKRAQITSSENPPRHGQ